MKPGVTFINTARGTCGLVGASQVGAEVSLDILHLMTAGRRVRGIVEGDSTPDVFIPTLINLYRQGRFPFDKMVKFYDLNSINDAIKDSEAGNCVKPIIRMQGITQEPAIHLVEKFGPALLDQSAGHSSDSGTIGE